MNKRFSMAIDGPSGAGKSTIARAVAERTGALYLDTGAMYRAVGLGVIRRGVDVRCEGDVAALVDDITIDVRHVDGVQRVFLDGEDVSDEIRTPEASDAASAVSMVPAVRVRMVAMQRAIAHGRSVVMDGRDIGTKVLPDATIKLYLVADVTERARRRYREMHLRGMLDSYEQVLYAMEKRDHDDSHRAASPLVRAKDAVELDTTGLTLAETVDRALCLLQERLEASGT